MTTSTASTQICPQCYYENPQEAQHCRRCDIDLSETLLQTAGTSPRPSAARPKEVQLADMSPIAHEPALDRHVPTAARLIHTEIGQSLELDPHGFVWRLGKPHQGASPDLDISPFPRAEIVSRAHALIRYDRGQYYIEDTNSSNGTFVNHKALVPGRRYPLGDGDYIVFGKGDLVSFLFQIHAA